MRKTDKWLVVSVLRAPGDAGKVHSTRMGRARHDGRSLDLSLPDPSTDHGTWSRGRGDQNWSSLVTLWAAQCLRPSPT